MTIEDNKKYKLTGEQIKDLASRISILSSESDEKAEKAQTGSTAPTTSTPGEIGQLYIQSDGTVYILKNIVEESGQPDEYTWEEVGAGIEYTAGDGIDITNDVISATNTGKAKVLTTADYNWPTDNPDGVAIWLLDPGTYHCEGVKTYINSNYSDTNTHSFIVSKSGGITYVLHLMYNGDKIWWQYFNGNSQSDSSFVLSKKDVINGLNSTATDSPLSANQGKVLKGLIDAIPAPTTYTAGTGLDLTGTEFSVDFNDVQGKLTAGQGISIADESGDLVISATSTGPTVVQTTGTSTTDVMSQNAVTSMVFADPTTKRKVQIGNGASATGTTGIAIGSGAYAAASGGVSVGAGAVTSVNNYGTALGASANAGGFSSVAIGCKSTAFTAGVVSFGGSMLGTDGYNNSNYRLLTNVYDPQNDHDAATKGYVDNSLLGKQDALTAGSGISIADESGSLVISTTVAEPDEFTSSEWNALWS